MKIGEYPRMSSVEDTDVFVFSRPSDGTKSIRAEDLIRIIADEVATETLLDTIVDQVQTRLLDKAYPVGSIYMSLDSTEPSELFGGTWERIAQGRCLFGANDSTYVSGQTKNAGLPNIIGSFAYRYCQYEGVQYANGAFSKAGRSATTWNGSITSTTDPNAGELVDFNAARVNSIYGASSTVQPPALVVYMWKRTA